MTATPASAPTFVKGHGTQNDFIVLLDPDGVHGLSERQARALCDRRQGLGADGVLRAVPAESGGWFMDYRNADGSAAEMCGNGVRVFALVLRDAGLVASDAFPVQTRGGERFVRISEGQPGGAEVTVDMGAATSIDAEATVTCGDRVWKATPVWVPNPHAVAFTDDLAHAGPLTSPPAVTPERVFPDGVNVEFVVTRGEDRIAMRVHERGVGETRSCGTGAVAAAWAWRRRPDTPRSAATAEPKAHTVRVDVPGGTVWVTEHDDGHLDLRGPAVVVARGAIEEHWWKEHA